MVLSYFLIFGILNFDSFSMIELERGLFISDLASKYVDRTILFFFKARVDTQ